MDYILHIMILIGIYAILSISLNLMLGYTGILSIAHASFYSVGAYVAAIFSLNLDVPFLLILAIAILCSSILGVLVGMPSIRIQDDYFAIATFAFQIIMFSFLNNLVSITGGPLGLFGIPQPVIFGIKISTNWQFLFLVGIFCIFTFWLSTRLVNSPIGRILKAIREDEVFAQSLGKKINTYKVLIVMIGASLASIAGVLYASYISFIDPTSFSVIESIFIISIVIIGGAGNMWGSIVGACVLIAMPELLRFIGLPNSIAPNIKQIIYGLLLVAFMLWRPQGLLGQYAFYRNIEKK